MQSKQLRSKIILEAVYNSTVKAVLLQTTKLDTITKAQ